MSNLRNNRIERRYLRYSFVSFLAEAPLFNVFQVNKPIYSRKVPA